MNLYCLAYSAFSSSVLLKPQVRVSDNALMVMLPNRNTKSSTEGLSVKESAVMCLFEKSEDIKRKALEEVLGVSQTMAGRVLRQLVEIGKIEANGEGPSRAYSRKRGENRRMIREDFQENVGIMFQLK